MFGLLASRGSAQGEPPGWVGPFSELSPAPLDLRDVRVPLDQRIALADALGEHGPAKPAIASLQAALEAEPPPPSRLREAIALALARRGAAVHTPPTSSRLSVPEPVGRLLKLSRTRAAGQPPRTAQKPGAAWLERPRSGQPMVQAFLRETDPATLRAMAHKLGELELLGLTPPNDPHVLAQALCDRETAPNALLMLAAEAKRAPSETTRRLLRAALAGVPCASEGARAPDDDPHAVAVRILGALGLAAIDDTAAVPALRHALRSPFARVRLAAAAALSLLATHKACAALDSHARIEGSAQVRRALACTPRSRD
jgi:HEAT repeat protein